MNDTTGTATRSTTRTTNQRRVAVIAATCALGLLTLALLGGGAWALWVDRMDRDSNGFVSTGPLELRTDTYAIVGQLRGDGPRWLYGSAVLGDARVRVTSESGHRRFVGIAHTTDVARYLNGAGYATIDHFGTSAATTHSGGAPTLPATQASIWAAATDGTGELTLPWTPRSGDWSIVLMNADASAGVTVRGSLAAKLPILPWVAGSLLIAGLATGASASWLFVRLVRSNRTPAPAEPEPRDDEAPALANALSGFPQFELPLSEHDSEVPA